MAEYTDQVPNQYYYPIKNHKALVLTITTETKYHLSHLNNEFLKDKNFEYLQVHSNADLPFSHLSKATISDDLLKLGFLTLKKNDTEIYAEIPLINFLAAMNNRMFGYFPLIQTEISLQNSYIHFVQPATRLSAFPNSALAVNQGKHLVLNVGFSHKGEFINADGHFMRNCR